MACPTQTFKVTPAEWQQLQQRAKAQGLAITAAPNGAATADGITVTWSYDSATGALALTCTNKPWYISCDLVSSRMTALIAGNE